MFLNIYDVKTGHTSAVYELICLIYSKLTAPCVCVCVWVSSTVSHDEIVGPSHKWTKITYRHLDINTLMLTAVQVPHRKVKLVFHHLNFPWLRLLSKSLCWGK